MNNSLLSPFSKLGFETKKSKKENMEWTFCKQTQNLILVQKTKSWSDSVLRGILVLILCPSRPPQSSHFFALGCRLVDCKLLVKNTYTLHNFDPESLICSCKHLTKWNQWLPLQLKKIPVSARRPFSPPSIILLHKYMAFQDWGHGLCKLLQKWCFFLHHCMTLNLTLCSDHRSHQKSSSVLPVSLCNSRLVILSQEILLFLPFLKFLVLIKSYFCLHTVILYGGRFKLNWECFKNVHWDLI